jgi:L-ascorbate metabolism protein UlaG (beta-lactamase superfamily)
LFGLGIELLPPRFISLLKTNPEGRSMSAPLLTPAVKKGHELQAEIRDTEVRHGQVALWWLGQASFCLKFGPAIVYIDPFFRPPDGDMAIMQEMPLKPHEFTGAALICCTHDHLDHIDPQTLPGAAAASPLAEVIVPQAACQKVASLNVPAGRIRTLSGDDQLDCAGVTVHALPAAHMELEHTPENGHKYLGYVLQGNGVTVYHTGDTQPYEGWARRVDRFPLDIALLPINGHDNLHWPQAVYFCALHRPKLAIPMHYGMFPGYTEDPLVFAKALSLNAPRQQVRILQVGERYMHDSLG